ncbi:MAG: ATP-binding protein [Planctomycetota bacterium]
MDPMRELELLRLLHTLRQQVAVAQDEAAVARVVLRAALRFLPAASVAVGTLASGGQLQELWRAGDGRELRDDGLRSYLLRGEWPRPVATRLVARIERRRRMWGVMVADADEPFPGGDGHSLVLLAELLARRIQELDRQRASDVRARIDGKIMAQLRPQDLYYQILHGLRSLTGYDHSGALYVCERDDRRLRLVAEQVAWRKRKSARIGALAEPHADELAALRRGETCGFDRTGEQWTAWRGGVAANVLEVLQFGHDAPASASILLAPLVVGRGMLGLIKLASVRARSLGEYEADLLQRFLPQATVAIRNAEKTESLKESVLRAERKHAMADLARGVAHDVNNALGSILPIVQQLRAELRDGSVDPTALAADLERIDDAVATCRRIFGGMLAFAKSAGRSVRNGDLGRAIAAASSILRSSATRRGADLHLEVPDVLPQVVGAQHELEQLFLNLMSNACEASPRGGRVTVRASLDGGHVEVRVCDQGKGMSRTELARVEEAFYSTKPNGTGLGLAICRSIVGDIGASMRIESEPGVGTSVALLLPLAARRGRGEASA